MRTMLLTGAMLIAVVSANGECFIFVDPGKK
jgi:hypothetical protein